MESSRERWNCIPKVVSPKSNFPARGWKSCWSHTLTATSPNAPGRQNSKQRLLKHVVSRLCSLSESCPKPWFIVDLLEYSVTYIYVNTGIWYMYMDKPVGAGVITTCFMFFLYIYRFTYLKRFLWASFPSHLLLRRLHHNSFLECGKGYLKTKEGKVPPNIYIYII